MLADELTRDQVKSIIYKFVQDKFLDKEGTGSGTKYFLSSSYKKGTTVIDKALKLGIKQMKESGELSDDF